MIVSQSIAEAKRLVAAGESDCETIISKVTELISSKAETRIDYVQICHQLSLEEQKQVDNDSVILLAVFVGKTRLIDNSFLQKVCD